MSAIDDNYIQFFNAVRRRRDARIVVTMPTRITLFSEFRYVRALRMQCGHRGILFFSGLRTRTKAEYLAKH